MGDFFKPWRRKTGVVTLVMALTLACGWARSRVVADQLAIRIGPDRVFWMISNDDWTGLAILKAGPYEYRESSFQYWNSVPLPNHRNGGPFSGINHSWDWYVRRYYIFPYFLLVIPLTLLSAWLLLSKARPTAKVNATDPSTGKVDVNHG